MKRTVLKAAVAGLAAWALSGATCVERKGAGDTQAGGWVGAWSAAPDSPGPALDSQTLRQIVRTSIGGSAVRIRLSNLFGDGPVTIGAAQLARHRGGGGIDLGSDRAVTFGGNPGVTIAKGADMLSDPVNLDVAALEELAVSLYLPGKTGASTVHSVAMQTGYVARGDATKTERIADVEPEGSRFFITDVEVLGAPGSRVLVTLGDSITDGVGSTEDANKRWPDQLAARLQASPRLASVAVVNSGIAGNRLLNDAVEPYLGPSSLNRLDRDVLGKPGVTWVLVLQGGNDISGAERLPSPNDKVSADDIIAGLKTLIDRAHVRGIRIWGGTLTPRGGARWPFDSEPGEAKRQAVNAWVRTSGAFDAVVDFDAVLRDPAEPLRLQARFDSGDHVHPNDAGFAAMAAAINLALFEQ
jgi:lysophospholipase L1-like esterase